MMSESSCVNCGAQIIPEGARSCDNCGMPVSGAAPPQEEEEAPRLEAPADAQTPAPSPPVEQPISFLPPTREAQQSGMPVSGAAPAQEEEEAPRLEAPADAQTPAPSPPVEQPISFLPPTREAQQNRVRRGWPTRLTLREKDLVLLRRYILVFVVTFVVALVVALIVVATMSVLEALQTGGRPCIVVGTTRWCL